MASTGERIASRRAGFVQRIVTGGADTLAWVAVAWLATILPATAAVAQVPDDRIAAQAHAYMQARVEAGFFSGVVLIARDGEPVFAGAYGFADEDARLPNAIDTRFQIASITKIFTASVIMRLQDGGRLHVDDPVCRYLDPCPDSWRPVTIRHLLTHTSGLPNHTVDTRFVIDEAFSLASRSPITPEQLVAMVGERPLQAPPGERYSYTNAGYAVLALVAEAAGGQPYEALLQALVLTPLELGDTGVYRPDSPGVAKGYVPDGVDNARAPFMDPSWLYGSGDLCSTVGDLLKLDRALTGGAWLSRETLAEMWTADRGAYGYGWQIMASPRDGFSRPFVFHAGGNHGFSTDYLRYDGDGVSLFILSNLGSAPMLPISRDLSAIVFGDPYRAPVVRRPAAVSPDVLADYAGRYRIAPGAHLTLRVEDGRLSVQVDGQPPDLAIPESDTRFYSRLGDTQMTLVRDDSGTVTGLVIHQGGRDIAAERIAPD